MKLRIGDDRACLLVGDSADVHTLFPSESVDSLVTDPPAGIGFMGREWDSDKGGRLHWIEWLSGVLRGAHTLLKPGGHALVWALPRTAHWTMTALEDAGFEVRDVVSHMFGTGFPKSLDVSKAIDKAAGAATPGAAAWGGWGTALKPAAEFWILARKPLSGAVAANVLEHGTGALNIDGCRIGRDLKPDAAGRWPANVVLSHDPDCVPLGEVRVRADRNSGAVTAPRQGDVYGAFGAKKVFDYADADGCEAVERFACVPECAVRALDDQTGELKQRRNKGPSVARSEHSVAMGRMAPCNSGAEYNHGGKGGASRFFYTAKVSRSERDHGCEHLEHKSGAEVTDRGKGARNHHPTVKPQALMRWLVRLITPPGGTVLDLFSGSGSTAVAALAEGFNFIGVELSDEYAEIAAARITQALKDYPPTTEGEATA